MTLTAERARQLLDYNPETGGFTRKSRHRSEFGSDLGFAIWNGKYAGKPAGGWFDRHGYIMLKVDRRTYSAHRLAWLIAYGYWPDQIDHADGCKTNNRITNLRDVTARENMRNRGIPRNNKSGVLGVYRRGKRWRAVIKADLIQHNIGHFDSFDEAVRARAAAERQFGFHPNHGKAAA